MKNFSKYLLFILMICLCTTTYASATYTYSVYGSSSTTSGGGTWGAILKMTLWINSNKTFSVSVGKQSGSFSSAGWMYLQGESYGVSSSYNLASCRIYEGNYSKTLVSGKTLDNMPSSWWHSNKLKVYCRYEATGGGYAYVGPIYIQRKESCSVVLKYDGWEYTYDENGKYICSDNCDVTPGQVITHKWRLRNEGTCDAKNYRLSHRSGHNGNATYPSFSISAGGTGIAEVKNFRVPTSTGKFSTYFNILPCSGCSPLPDLSGGGLYFQNTVKRSEFNINAKANSGGSISPSGDRTVSAGGSITFSIRANSGYDINYVKVNGSSQGAISSYRFSNVSSNHTIEAFFKPKPNLKIIARVSSGEGSISPGGNVYVSWGSSKTFSIRPDSCYEISNVKVDGSSQGKISSYTFRNVTSNHTIDAYFTRKYYKISTSVKKGNGNISPSGNVSVACGSSKTFSIGPSNHSEISNIKVDGVSKGKITSYTFRNISNNHTIDAYFDDLPNPVITSSVRSGKGTISPYGKVSVNWGANKTYTIKADDCYRISNVKVDGNSQGAISSYTFRNVNGDHNIDAYFEQISYSVKSTAEKGGKISPQGNANVKCGNNVTFSMTPDNGYEISDVIVNGQSIGKRTSYTFSNVNRDKQTIHVTFKPIQIKISIHKSGRGDGTLSHTTQYVNYGSNLTISAKAAVNSVLKGWSGDAQGVGNAVFNNITSEKSITAQFDIKTYNVSIHKKGNGEGSLSENTQTVEYGTTLLVKATPSENSTFIGWSGDAQGNNDAVLNNITSDKSITAQFDKKTFIVSISKNGTGDGTFSEKTQTVDYGTNLTVKAIPAESSAFMGWSGDASGTDDAFLSNITSNKSITATFDLKQTHPKLTGIEISGNNTIEEGKTSKFTAKAIWADGSFSDINSDVWSVSPEIYCTIDQSGILSTQPLEKDQMVIVRATYTVDDITHTDSISVTIKNNTKISLHILGNGSGNANGSVIIDNTTYALPHNLEVEKDETISVKAKADKGWQFMYWSGSITDSSDLIEILMNDEKTVTANFLPSPPAPPAYSFNVSEISGSGKVIVNDVTCSVAPCDYSFPSDSDIKIVAEPSDLFVSWSENLNSTEPIVSIVLTDNMTIKAEFSEPSVSGVALDMDFNTRNYDDTISDKDIDSSISASLNDEIWIAVVAQGTKNIDTLQVEVQYDTSKLEFLNGAEDNTFGGIRNHLKKNNGETVGFKAIESSTGIVNIANALAGSDESIAPEGTGIIALLNFKVLSQDAENKLTLQNVVFIDSKGASTKINQLMDGCINCCPQWDFVRDEDMIINYRDLGAFADHWLLTEDDDEWDERFNLSPETDHETGKQIINYRDLGIFADHWLEPSPCSN
ncbi:conserved hypothetical protein, secreted [Candidatus Magnetomorum sp. HK-1]|nr:conserved hypothetical protein, secreted [Candidatus Magnetomorum sp. HK-1]